ncbi:MAG: MarC family protein [Prevotellaceae bacterium]|jgi:multiple antibiotic resistance protein|nr:MarC family protein [Prevotellaceae bacterium]
MNLNIQAIFSVFIILFAIIDILGSIPIILGLKERGEEIRPVRATLVSIGILLAFLFAGKWLLNLFHVNIESFAVAGSIVIFIYALEMILDIEIIHNNGPKGTSSIVPLAFPLIAGPASFTALLSLRASYDVENIIVGLLLNMILVFLVLRSTDKIEKKLGRGVIYVFRKFFGVILLAVSVQLFTTNLGELINVVK